MKKFSVLVLILISTSLISTNVKTKEKTQIQWVDGLYTKSITDEFIYSSKDFNKSTITGRSLMMMPLGSGDFSGDGIPEIVYGMQFTDLKKGSIIKPIFLTTSTGKGLSLFKPIMDVVPYVSAPRDSVIADFNGDGINDTWAIKGANSTFFPSAQINIFNRFGKIVAQIDIDTQGWDGTYGGKILASDDYWFSIILVDRNGALRERKGNFSLLRR